MAKINEKLNACYEYVKNYIQENGYAPSVRDICKDLNIKSTATAHLYLKKLSENGLIDVKSDKKRAISLNSSYVSGVPLIGTVAAGQPIFATENYEDYYTLPKDFNTSEDLFMLTIKGNSMQNAGILNGDKIVVKKQNDANNGDIVVALLDDSATCKRFFKKDDKIILHPENDDYSDIIVNDVQILGKVVGLIRKF
ncbi:MAG: transcriptional repressor LexA [Clostridia bacterium]|nr:transcriptional repressor LexA [Clostridia bacterium]